jgi:hypothetical protein
METPPKEFIRFAEAEQRLAEAEQAAWHERMWVNMVLDLATVRSTPGGGVHPAATREPAPHGEPEVVHSEVRAPRVVNR